MCFANYISNGAGTVSLYTTSLRAFIYKAEPRYFRDCGTDVRKLSPSAQPAFGSVDCVAARTLWSTGAGNQTPFQSVLPRLRRPAAPEPAWFAPAGCSPLLSRGSCTALLCYSCSQSSGCGSIAKSASVRGRWPTSTSLAHSEDWRSRSSVSSQACCNSYTCIVSCCFSLHTRDGPDGQLLSHVLWLC